MPIENLERPHVTVDATHDATVAEGDERQLQETYREQLDTAAWDPSEPELTVAEAGWRSR